MKTIIKKDKTNIYIYASVTQFELEQLKKKLAFVGVKMKASHTAIYTYLLMNKNLKVLTKTCETISNEVLTLAARTVRAILKDFEKIGIINRLKKGFSFNRIFHPKINREPKSKPKSKSEQRQKLPTGTAKSKSEQRQKLPTKTYNNNIKNTPPDTEPADITNIIGELWETKKASLPSQATSLNTQKTSDQGTQKTSDQGTQKTSDQGTQQASNQGTQKTNNYNKSRKKRKAIRKYKKNTEKKQKINRKK